MRLTADLIDRSTKHVNTLNDRELDLRGHALQFIENLGCTQDEFTTFDMSNNSFQSLGNFPLLNRLKTLFVNNCNICNVESTLAQSLPNLEVLVIQNNDLSQLGQLVALKGLLSLRQLSLVGNDVTSQPNYFHVMIHLVPSLDILDYTHIKSKDRYLSKKFFESEEGVALAKQLESGRPVVVPKSSGSSEFSVGGTKRKAGQQLTPAAGATTSVLGEPNADVLALRARIVKAVQTAKSLDDLTQLSQILQGDPTVLTPTIENVLKRVESAAQ